MEMQIFSQNEEWLLKCPILMHAKESKSLDSSTLLTVDEFETLFLQIIGGHPLRIKGTKLSPF